MNQGDEQTHRHTYPLHFKLTRNPDAFIHEESKTRSVGQPPYEEEEEGRCLFGSCQPDLKFSDENVVWIQQFDSHDTAEHQGDEVTEPDEEGDLVLVPFVWYSRAVSFCPFQPCVSPENSRE